MARRLNPGSRPTVDRLSKRNPWLGGSRRPGRNPWPQRLRGWAARVWLAAQVALLIGLFVGAGWTLKQAWRDWHAPSDAAIRRIVDLGGRVIYEVDWDDEASQAYRRRRSRAGRPKRVDDSGSDEVVEPPLIVDRPKVRRVLRVFLPNPLNEDGLPLKDGEPLDPDKYEALAVSDQDLECLRDLTQLRTLAIISHRVTDDGLRQLQSLTRLQTLELGCPQLTDRGLPYLRRMRLLSSLRLSGSGITDRGLESLTHLRQLKHLELSGTSVTPEGVARLGEKLRGCRIQAGK